MSRTIGFALLLVGLIGPTVISVCNSQCQSMQSPVAAGTYFDDAALACCLSAPTTVTGPVSVQPQFKFRNVVRLDAHIPSVLHLEAASFEVLPLRHDRLLPLSRGHSLSILRI